MNSSQGEVNIFTENTKIILASGSPRRKQMLKRIGLIFQSIPVDIEPEPFLDEPPELYVVRAAKAKAEAVAALHPDACIIAADTIVVYRGTNTFPRIIGKPKNMEEALRILTALQGGQHHVLTACCIVWPTRHDKEIEKYELWVDTAVVVFGQWPKNKLQEYVKTGEPQDKAGSFSIEGIGGFLINRIEGNYMTVLGLPLSELLIRLMRGGAIQ